MDHDLKLKSKTIGIVIDFLEDLSLSPKSPLDYESLINLLKEIKDAREKKENEKISVPLADLTTQIVGDLSKKLENRKKLLDDKVVLANWNIYNAEFTDKSKWIKFVYTDGVIESSETKVVVKADLSEIGLAFPYDQDLVYFFNGKKRGTKRVGYWNKPYWICDIDKISIIRENPYFNNLKYNQIWDKIGDLIRAKGQIQADTIPNTITNIIL